MNRSGIKVSRTKEGISEENIKIRNEMLSKMNENIYEIRRNKIIYIMQIIFKIFLFMLIPGSLFLIWFIIGRAFGAF